MVDKIKKQKDIENDYINTIACFENITTLLKYGDLEIKENDSKEKKIIKEGKKRETLVLLGRTAEMSFKYILKLIFMDLEPNLTYDEFINKLKVNKTTINFLANRMQVNKGTLVQDILKTHESGPISHDFYCIYSIFDKIFPDIITRYKEVIKLNLKSKNAMKVMKELGVEEYSFVCFPELAFTLKGEVKTDVEEIIEILKERNKTIKKSGNIFTRFRYHSENKTRKKCDINEIYELVADVVLYIKLIHLNKGKLNFDLERAYSKYMLIENKENFNIRFSKDEIEKLYSNKKLDIEMIEVLLFYNKLSFSEIEEILKSKIRKNDYLDIFYNSLNLETIEYFKSIGIDSYLQMRCELSRKGKDKGRNFLNVVFDDRYTLNEYKAIRKKYKMDKYPNILDLQSYMSLGSIKKISNDEKLTKFLSIEFLDNTISHVYNYDDKFEMLLSINELKQNMELWYSLDSNQLSIYENVVNMFSEDEIKNINNYSEEDIKTNIKENIEFFKNDEKMLKIMPLMLDRYDTLYILELLKNDGLNLDNINELDTTILCMPPIFVSTIKILLNKENELLIKNNNINPRVYDIFNEIRSEKKSNVEIKKREITLYEDKDSDEIKYIKRI